MGILGGLMVTLLWDFYASVIAYDPLEAIAPEQVSAEEDAKAEAAYRYAWGKEIAEKNLFDRGRGFVNSSVLLEAFEPEPEPEAPRPERPLLRLNGIIRDRFGEHVAYIYRNNVLLPPLRRGDVAEDIVVTGITERDVTISWEGEEIKLTMAKIKTLKR